MSRFHSIVRSWSAISRSLPQFAPARRPHARRRFTLERLKGRSLLSTVHLTVNTLADDPSGPTTGQITLRDAINQADDTSNSYVIKFAVKGTIDLTSALPALDNSIAIQGPGVGNLTIEGQQALNPTTPNPQFIIDKGNIVSLSNMTITEGGILNNGNLTVSEITFTNNPQGAIGNSDGYDMGSTLSVSHCVFVNNAEAINSAAQTLIVTDSIFLDNNFGAIRTSGDTTDTLRGDVFTDNSSMVGGAVWAGGTWTITDSMFIDNSASVAGGAIYIGGTATINNSIFFDNSATGTLGSGIYTGDGGGIASSTTGTLAISNSIFVDNSAIRGGGIWHNSQIGTLITTNDLFFDNTGGDIYP